MDFGDNADDARFRAELRDWLPAALAQLPPADPMELAERLAQFRVWQRLIFDAGYAGLSWPRRHGGREAGVMERVIWAEELDRAGAPEPLNGVGEAFAGPTIIEFGTDAQRERFLRPILEGREIWCQLFSEPEAGSDLAGLQARAERVDGGWQVNGQKVWTSRAQIADHGLLLARTGAPRHAGITYFLLPMDQAGIVVRPLTQITGEAEFNEVFLEDVFVPDELVLGDVDDGWRIARATLQYERASIALGRVNIQRWVDELITEIRARDDAGDPLVRQRIAALHGRAQAHRLTALRSLTRMARGEPPGPESSVGKLYLSGLLADIADFGVELGGLDRALAPEYPAAGDDGRWQRRALFARGMSLAGGTPNIQRNIVAERVLGLPR